MIEMLDFYIAPDFLSSHDLGILAKKTSTKKRKTHFDHEKNKNKVSKKQKKNNTCTVIVFADL